VCSGTKTKKDESSFKDFDCIKHMVARIVTDGAAAAESLRVAKDYRKKRQARDPSVPDWPSEGSD
jgi:hypothetical protein